MLTHVWMETACFSLEEEERIFIQVALPTGHVFRPIHPVLVTVGPLDVTVLQFLQWPAEALLHPQTWTQSLTGKKAG